jgi:hypothetical protein
MQPPPAAAAGRVACCERGRVSQCSWPAGARDGERERKREREREGRQAGNGITRREKGKRAKGRIGAAAPQGLQSPGGILCGAEVHRPWRPLRPLLACEAWSPFPRSHLRPPPLTLAGGGPYCRSPYDVTLLRLLG